MGRVRTLEFWETQGCRVAMALLTGAFVALLLSLVFGGPAVAEGLVGGQANVDDELIFLDGNGVIRVYDPTVAEGELPVAWTSPGGGWDYFALGDFNADGDAEIVAISDEGGNRLAVFDPVAEGVDPGDADGVINGYPWELLREEFLSGPPLVVAVGDFDLDAPADEIVYYYRMPDEEVVQADDPYRFVVQSAQGEQPDGRSWSTLLTYDSGNPWDKIVPGNYDGTGADELALIYTAQGNLSIYRITGSTLERIRRESGVDKEWQDGDAGQFVAGGQEELAVGREADLGFATLFVTYYAAPDVWPDYLAEYNDPPPRVVFMGDLNGSGDDEVVVLREVPAGLGNRPRLFVRNRGGDPIGLGELPLDADNGYRAGVAGDVDGDGREEVVIMRNNRIRIFTEPERSSNSVDEEVDTGAELILAGNLDANGLSGASRLGASPPSVADVVVAGTTSQPRVIALSDVVNGQEIPFTWRVAADSEWLAVTASGSSTPATLSVTLDASDVVTGTYRDQVIVETAPGAVANTPIAIDVEMTVQPGISLSPQRIVSVRTDCEDAEAPALYTLDVEGTAGAAYTLTWESPVAWASVSPATGTVPSIATVALDGQALGSGLGETAIVVRATLSGEQVRARAEVLLFCAEYAVLLPEVNR